MTITDPRPVLWITGAGSGTGRATAVHAASAGRRVALSGRRADPLEGTRALVEDAGGTAVVIPLDTGEGHQVAAAHTRIAAEFGTVTELVLAAGLNDPLRRWSDQSMDRFDSIVRTNLSGPARVIDAVLPGMRAAGGGTVVLVSSYSAWGPSPDAGIAYRASKTGLRALSDSLNEQENAGGIRCCHLCPGDIATDFLQLRPEVPDAAARERMLQPEDVATAAMFVLDSPSHVCVNELVITPVTRG